MSIHIWNRYFIRTSTDILKCDRPACTCVKINRVKGGGKQKNFPQKTQRELHTQLQYRLRRFCSQNHGLKKLPRSLDNGYWLTNKTHICFGPLHARYVIYLNFTIRMSFSTRASQVPGWRKSDQKQEIWESSWPNTVRKYFVLLILYIK